MGNLGFWVVLLIKKQDFALSGHILECHQLKADDISVCIWLAGYGLASKLSVHVFVYVHVYVFYVILDSSMLCTLYANYCRQLVSRKVKY